MGCLVVSYSLEVILTPIYNYVQNWTATVDVLIKKTR